jgi:hypothetical protein
MRQVKKEKQKLQKNNDEIMSSSEKQNRPIGGFSHNDWEQEDNLLNEEILMKQCGFLE